MFAVNLVAITAGTLTIALQAGDDPALSDAVAQTDANLVLGPAGVAQTAAGLLKFQYFGTKRYSRLTFTGNAGITGAIVHALYLGRNAARGGF